VQEPRLIHTQSDFDGIPEINTLPCPAHHAAGIALTSLRPPPMPDSPLHHHTNLYPGELWSG